MKSARSLHGAAVLALVAAAAASAGCVLVVGDGGSDGYRRADVEWASTRDHGTSATRPSADSGLAREVESRIRMDSSLEREDITVSSTGDVITLHGRVSDVALLENAMRIAAESPGVRRVVSRLTVTMEAG